MKFRRKILIWFEAGSMQEANLTYLPTDLIEIIANFNKTHNPKYGIGWEKSEEKRFADIIEE